MKVNARRDGQWVWDPELAKRTEPKTMTLNMPCDEMNHLELMANHTGQSKTDIARAAIRAYFVLFIKNDAGAKLYFKNEDGTETEIILV